MKIFILMFALYGSNLAACDITAPIPSTMRPHKSFIKIGQQFIKCIKSKESVEINFINYDMQHELIKDNKLKRKNVMITWLRESPNGEDYEIAKTNKQLFGISYHNLKEKTSLIKCKTPYTRHERETLGHEVLHAFIGNYHL